jgi:hypothetical protein
MIVSAAVVPHPPLLLKALSGAERVPEVEELREAAEQAIARVLADQPDVVFGVGGAQSSCRWPVGASLAKFAYLGQPRPDRTTLPLSLSVIAELMPRGAISKMELHSIASDASLEGAVAFGRALARRAQRVGLVVAGDGSARRGVKAPGNLDPRALHFDETIRAAFAHGDMRMLRSIDPLLAEQLMVAGRAAWQVLAGALEERTFRADFIYCSDPFGVNYMVAHWADAATG